MNVYIPDENIHLNPPKNSTISIQSPASSKNFEKWWILITLEGSLKTKKYSVNLDGNFIIHTFEDLRIARTMSISASLCWFRHLQYYAANGEPEVA